MLRKLKAFVDRFHRDKLQTEIIVSNRDVVEILTKLIWQADSLVEGQQSIDDKSMAELLAHRSRAHRGLGQYTYAIADMDRAIEIHERQGTVSIEQAELLFSRGLFNYESRNYQHSIGDTMRALEYFKEAENTKPDNRAYQIGACYQNLAAAYEGLGNFEKAIVSFTDAIEFYGSNSFDVAVCYRWRGLVFAETNDYAAALEDFTNAIKLVHNGKDTQAQELLANVYRHRAGVKSDGLKDHHAALPDLDKSILVAVSIQKEDSATGKATLYLGYHARGLAWYRLQEWDKAIADYSRALDLYEILLQGTGTQVSGGMYAQTLHNRGLAFLDNNDHPSAIRNFTDAIILRNKLIRDGHQLESQLAYSLCFRGDAYQGQGRYDEAIRDYEVAVELRESSLDDENLDQKANLAYIFQQRAYLLMKRKKFDDAIADCSKAIQLRTELRDAGHRSRNPLSLVYGYAFRGYCYRWSEKLDDAIQNYTQGIDIIDEWTSEERTGESKYVVLAHILFLRGMALGITRSFSRAIADFSRAVSIHDESFPGPSYGLAQALHFRGYYYEKSQDLSGAMADYSRSISILEASSEADLDSWLLWANARGGRGRVLLRENKLDAALQELDMAISRTGEVESTDKPRVNNILGMLFSVRSAVKIKLRQFFEAAEDSSKAILLFEEVSAAEHGNQTDLGKAYFNRAIAYSDLRRFGLSLSDYLKSVEIHRRLVESGHLHEAPHLMASHRACATLYGHLKRFESAAEHYAYAIRICESCGGVYPVELARLYYLRGIVHSKLRQVEAGVADFDRIIELVNDKSKFNPPESAKRTAWAIHRRGLLHHDKGNVDGAIRDIDQAIRLLYQVLHREDTGEIRSDIATCLFHRAEVLLTMGQRDRASGDVHQAIDLWTAVVDEQNIDFTEFAKCLRLLSDFLVDGGNLRSGIDRLTQAVEVLRRWKRPSMEIHELMSELFEQQALLQQQLGEIEGAKKSIKESVGCRDEMKRLEDQFLLLEVRE